MAENVRSRRSSSAEANPKMRRGQATIPAPEIVRGHACRQAPGGCRVRPPVVERSCAPGAWPEESSSERRSVQNTSRGPLRAGDSAKESRPPVRALVNVILELFGRFLVGVPSVGMAGRGGGLVGHPITEFPQVLSRVSRLESSAFGGQGSHPLQFMGRSQNQFLIVPLSVTFDVPFRRLAPGILPQHCIRADPIEFPNREFDAFCRYFTQCHWLLLRRLLGPLRNPPRRRSLAKANGGAPVPRERSPLHCRYRASSRTSRKDGRPKRRRGSGGRRFRLRSHRFRREAERFVRRGRPRLPDASLRESDGLPLDGRRSGVYLPVAF